ncbi:MAG TPA: energy transducer TonB [Bacteroidia bacterium]|nr:energy transducer TonB [Bacteroidia bacterium]
MVSKAEKQNRSWALIGTILFHALVFLFLYLYVIVTPIPPFPTTGSIGMEVDFGNNINGSGHTEANGMGDVHKNDNTQAQQTPSSNKTSDNNVATSDVEPSINLKATKDKKHSVKTTTTQNKVQHPSSDLNNALNKFKNDKSNGQTGGDGTSNHSGNAGNPDGKTPGEGNGVGQGGPGGTGYSLSGRHMTHIPSVNSNSPESGKVVVKIIVDENGNVISAVPGERGSTTTSSLLYAKAKQAALSAKFSPSTDGAQEQEGTITFIFILH